MIEYSPKDNKLPCPARLHDFVPLYDGGKLVGMVCVYCGKSTYEGKELSSLQIDESGKLKLAR